MNAEDLCGTVLGTCTLQKVIGRGGVGAVFLAQQSRPRRQVAVKVLLPITTLQPGQHKAFLNRFRRETDAAASLDHPNIMPVHEYGEREGLAYLVMPYISGGTLRDELETEGRLPLLRIVLYLEQIAAALDHAHERHIIHRDIKPANILMTPEKRLLLTDFGLVKILTDGAPPSNPLSEVGMPMGTPDYMAPEQVVGKKIDPRADIYSLGVLLYHMVTGTVPFKGNIPMKVALQHLEVLPPLPHTMRPDLPPAAEQVILRALAKKPNDRYACARDMSSAFRLALEAAGVQIDTGIGGNTNEERSGNRKRGLFDPLWRNSLQVPLQQPADASTPYDTSTKQPIAEPTIAPEIGAATKATISVASSEEFARGDIVAKTKITLPSFSGLLVNGTVPTIASTTQFGQGVEAMSLLDQDLMEQSIKTLAGAAQPSATAIQHTPLPAVPEMNNEQNISMTQEEFPPFVQFIETDQDNAAEQETPRDGHIFAPRLSISMKHKTNLQGLDQRRHNHHEPETGATRQSGDTGELTPTGTTGALNKAETLNKVDTPDDLDNAIDQYEVDTDALRLNQAIKRVRTLIVGKPGKFTIDIRSVLAAGQKAALLLLATGMSLNARMKKKNKIILLVALMLLLILIVGIFTLGHANDNNHPTKPAGLASPAATIGTTVRAGDSLFTPIVGKEFHGIDQPILSNNERSVF